MREEENQECGEMRPKEENALRTKEVWTGPRAAEEPRKVSSNLTNHCLGCWCLWGSDRSSCNVVGWVEPYLSGFSRKWKRSYSLQICCKGEQDGLKVIGEVGLGDFIPFFL